MKRWITAVITISWGMIGIAGVCACWFWSTSAASGVHHDLTGLHQRWIKNLVPHLEFVRIRDTVHVLGNRFIEVNLATQRLTLHYRHGDSLRLPLSSGNPDVREGISTPTGIFSIQHKTPKAISRQFGNTIMLWWIGFNYNIGFHGLEVSGYYRHLGKKPSSHGCLRMAREDVERLYNEVRIGDPVMVYDSLPSRIFAFGDSATLSARESYQLRSRNLWSGTMMAKRLLYLYQGDLYVRQPFAVYIDGITSLRPGGYQVGDAALCTQTQRRPVQGNALIPQNAIQDYFRRSFALPPAKIQKQTDTLTPKHSSAKPDTVD